MVEQDVRQAALARFREGPTLLERALAGLVDDDLDAVPARGGWTIRQIVHHIVDGDDLWKVGLKGALGDTDGEFTLAWYWALPQDTWAGRWAYARRSLDESLQLLAANRAHVLQLVATIPDAWSRAITVRKADGSVQRVSVGDIVAMQADHVEHHVERILAIRRTRETTG